MMGVCVSTHCCFSSVTNMSHFYFGQQQVHKFSFDIEDDS